MPKGILPHQGNITYIDLLLEEGRFITAGVDGYVRQWPYADIDEAEPTDEQPIVEVEPLVETYIGEGVEICGMTMNADSWMLEDRNGKLWKYDVAAESSVCIERVPFGSSKCHCNVLC